MMAIHGLKNIALAGSLLAIGFASLAQPVPPTLPTRPAPVSGRVGADSTAAVLHPGHANKSSTAAAPAVITSTARQVPPPANLNEPLLKAEGEPAATVPHPAAVVPSAAARSKPPVGHTDGHELSEATKGSQKARKKTSKETNKVLGHAHAGEAGAGRHKKKGSQGKAEKLAQAQVDAAQPHGATPKAKHNGKAKKAHAKTGHVKATPEAAAESKPHRHAAHHGHATSAPTVSTAHELKMDARAKHAVASKQKEKGEHKAGKHHGKTTGHAATSRAAASKVSGKSSSVKDAVKAKHKPAVHAGASAVQN